MEGIMNKAVQLIIGFGIFCIGATQVMANAPAGTSHEKFIVERHNSISVILFSDTETSDYPAAMTEGTPDECYNAACRFIIARM